MTIIIHAAWPSACRRQRAWLMRLVTTETISDCPVRQGQAIFACAVSGANVLRDMREAITNTIGGSMTPRAGL